MGLGDPGWQGLAVSMKLESTNQILSLTHQVQKAGVKIATDLVMYWMDERMDGCIEKRTDEWLDE